MKDFSFLLDWSTQASQAVHGQLISRGGKQELPLQIGQEKPPPSGLKNKWVANEIQHCFLCLPVSIQWNFLIKANKKATFVMESLVDQSNIFQGTFFSTRKFSMKLIKFQQNSLTFLMVHFLNFNSYFITFGCRGTSFFAM